MRQPYEIDAIIVSIYWDAGGKYFHPSMAVAELGAEPWPAKPTPHTPDCFGHWSWSLTEHPLSARNALPAPCHISQQRNRESDDGLPEATQVVSGRAMAFVPACRPSLCPLAKPRAGSGRAVVTFLLRASPPLRMWARLSGSRESGGFWRKGVVSPCGLGLPGSGMPFF